MRPMSRFACLAFVFSTAAALSGCPEQKAEVKGEPTSDNADKSGAAEGDKAAEPKKEEKKEDEGGW